MICSVMPVVHRKGFIEFFAVFFLLFAVAGQAEQWKVLGPDGGDVRSLAYDPRNPGHLFLGTGTGTIFESTDAGAHWAWLARLGRSDDYVLDHILMDPGGRTIYVSAWSLVSPGGDLFRSRDGGKTWEALSGMRGKSTRALAVAPSDFNILTAGTIDGVYRSPDGGETWRRISPADYGEIKNIESIAVDPTDPNIVYAGTRHLAWKTQNGGATWQRIDTGMINDSDIFSIIVDSSDHSVVFVGACSGIYKSKTGGQSFQKVQGIPFSARRTRVLKQDPIDHRVVYAGTTEGLWKTMDAGTTWKRMTSSQIVVNDVLVDPRSSKNVLLATDRGGVMASDDGGETFASSNRGYAHRYITALVVDKNAPGVLFVGVVNDREWGGVFSSRDGGQRWEQRSTGLGGRDVFALEQSAEGTLVAGTNRGIFMLGRGSNQWRSSNRVNDTTAATGKMRLGTHPVATEPEDHLLLNAKVNEIELTPQRWLAATSAGLFSSTDEGKSWSGNSALGRNDLIAVESSGEQVVVATRTAVLVSKNDGTEWRVATLPSPTTRIYGLTGLPNAQILVASREGVFRSSDGETWEHVLSDPSNGDIDSISYDETSHRLFATSLVTGVILESTNGGRSWRSGPDSGYPLRQARAVQGRFIAVTNFDGVILEP